MNIQSNQQKTNQPWWHREKTDGLAQTIGRIQKVNDPSTYADEVLKGSKVLLIFLLFFSGVLGALSYFKNFNISFPAEVAIFLALTLTFVIEWGKNKAATWAVRIPFFQGWGYLGATPSNTFIFGGLVLVALATFTMSMYNSTKGGEQLAQMLAHEKNSSSFVPDTKAIDEQSMQLQQSVTAAPLVKWKGKQYYQDPKSVRAASKSIESLQRQREQAITMQRADYERNLAVQSAQTNFAARLVLASGGWIELLQILLIFLRVACERSLAGKSSHASSPTFQSTGTTTQRSAAIGFNLGNDGNVRRQEQQTVSVPQSPPSVPQVNASVFLSPAEALLWFESELKKEPANFENKHANGTTVAARIDKKLTRAERYLEATPDQSIPQLSADRFSKYLSESLYPLLIARNYTPNGRIISLLDTKVERR